MRPDGRKSLEVLRSEWEECTKCDLGVQRKSNMGELVVGEGVRRGILFVGEGPNEDDEREGRPFLSKGGELVRKILDGLGFTDFYMTNLVACRSCEYRKDDAGQLILKRGRGKSSPPTPWRIDMPPKPLEWGACLDRLHEEIYLVDPVLIVSLGGTAAEALIGKSVTITKTHGQPVEITIPGASFDPVFTEKKKEWYHKVRGELVAPIAQTQVRYLLVPALHPNYVLKKIADKGVDSPCRLLIEDIRRAIKIYEKYISVVFNAPLTNQTSASDRAWEDIETNYIFQE